MLLRRLPAALGVFVTTANALSTVTPRLEPIGATYKTLQGCDVYRPSGKAVSFQSLLPDATDENDRVVVALLRHFG